MSSHIGYIGAIRIKPMVEEGLAKRMENFLEIRHMKRDVSILKALYPTLEDRKAVTLMADGNFGPEGLFFIPTTTKTKGFEKWTQYVGEEGLINRIAYLTAPKGCPSLYSELKLVSAPDGTCSYLGWTEEQAEDVPEWIALIASLLVPAGYHLDGKMLAIEDGGERFEQIVVENADVKRAIWEPDVTYDEEFQQAWEY